MKPTPGLPQGMSDAPLAPPPLISPAAALGAGIAAGLAWLWGFFNGRIVVDGTPGDNGDFPIEGWGYSSIRVREYITGSSFKRCGDDTPAGQNQGSSSEAEIGDYGLKGISYENFGEYNFQYSCEGPDVPTQVEAAIILKRDGWNQRIIVRSNLTGPVKDRDNRYSEKMAQNGVDLLSLEINRVPVVFPPMIDPLYVPPLFDPELQPEEEESPQPPLPITPPDAPPVTAPPEVEPIPGDGTDTGTGTGTGTDTGTGTGTGLVPFRPPIPLPVPIVVPQPQPDPETDPDRIPLPPVVTPPTLEQTPDGPIGDPAKAPPPTLPGIAEWVGKIEEKTMYLLERPNPGPDWADLIEALLDALPGDDYNFPAGEYLLRAACGETSTGAPGPPKVAKWSAGSGQFTELRERLDALAELLQHHKDLRQPVCHVRSTGQELTVDFVEDRAGSWEDRPLRKTLSYKDQGGGSLESHTAGWLGFVWEAGPVQLASYGKWGKVQVYAANRAEAERVIRHAAALAGYDPNGDPDHRWIEGTHAGGRIGRTGTMKTREVPGGIAVRWRDGPSGPSYTSTTPGNM